MAIYAGGVRSITPSTTDDNWALTAGASKSGKIIEVSWGGEATTSTAMCTRVARGSGQTGNTTAITNAKKHPNSPSSGLVLGSTFATTQPTLDAGDLFATSWNAHGGVIRWLAAPDEEFVIIGASTETVICNRNSVGTATSSYHTVWSED
jgi:hypothetical protein